VVVATPALLKLSVVLPSVAPLVDSVAVWPESEVEASVQGLELSAQAVTVTVLAWQVRLLLGSESS
jgi:hypothetical protein